MNGALYKKKNAILLPMKKILLIFYIFYIFYIWIKNTHSIQVYLIQSQGRVGSQEEVNNPITEGRVGSQEDIEDPFKDR